MKILLTGATGFLGRRLLRELLAAGHRVVCAGRRQPACDDTRCTWLKLEFTTTPSEAWQPHLRDVDAVVNLVGIFREHGSATFDAVHVRAPAALFDASCAAGVPRVVQVSALGADAQATTPFLLTKHAADRHLLGLPLDACVALPSLVFGVDGASARQFATLASMPMLPLPAGGHQRVQPIHVDDAAKALLRLVEAPPGSVRGQRVALVGPRALSLRDYLLALREAMGLRGAVPQLPVPAALMAGLARLGDLRRHALLDSASWHMLQQGSAANASAITAVLGHPPRPAADFIAPDVRHAVRLQARLGWLLLLLRGSLAFVWLATAAVSLGLYPVAASHALLAQAGLPAQWQAPALWSAALLDLVLGVLTLCHFRGRRWLWVAQGLLILFYSAVIAVQLPEFWLHPYGPMTKNVPFLAVLVLLWCLEPRDDESRT